MIRKGRRDTTEKQHKTENNEKHAAHEMSAKNEKHTENEKSKKIEAPERTNDTVHPFLFNSSLGVSPGVARRPGNLEGRLGQQSAAKDPLRRSMDGAACVLVSFGDAIRLKTTNLSARQCQTYLSENGPL